MNEHIIRRTFIDFEEEIHPNSHFTWRIQGSDGIKFGIVQTFVAEDADAVIASIITYIDEVAENLTTLTWPAWKATMTQDFPTSASNGLDNAISSEP